MRIRIVARGKADGREEPLKEEYLEDEHISSTSMDRKSYWSSKWSVDLKDTYEYYFEGTLEDLMKYIHSINKEVLIHPKRTDGLFDVEDYLEILDN